MNWLSRFLPGSGPGLNREQQARLEAVAALPAAERSRTHYETRYVVVNAKTGPAGGGGQRLLAVGAVALNHGLIHPDEAFHAALGDTPADVLIDLLRFIARSPIVVFNAAFNQGSVERAFEQHLGSKPELDWIDLMVLMPGLYPERISGQAPMEAWLAVFGIDRFDQRDALLEALAVAQLHQVALARASVQGLTTPDDLLDTQNNRQWLRGG